METSPTWQESSSEASLENVRTIWKPQIGPQEALLECGLVDIFYGGARGGGKTDALLGSWAAHQAKYGKNAVGALFRRNYKDLDEVVRRSAEIYGPLGAKWVGGDTYEWRFKNGAVLRLRYLDRDEIAERYQGHSYTWLGFDELPSWPSPKPIDKLWATLRSASNVKVQRISTGNPGGPGHGWVKRRYIDPAPMGYQPFKYYPLAERTDLFIEAVFIPARLEDNQLLVDADPTYEARLALSGNAKLFDAWRWGVWDIPAGQFFTMWDEARHVYEETEKIEAWWPRWISIDWGYNHPSAAYWYALSPQQEVYVYKELIAAGRSPKQLGEDILYASPQSEKIENVYISPDARHKRTSEKSIEDQLADVWRGTHLPMPSLADDDRKGGAMLVVQLLNDDRLHVSPACKGLIECIPTLVHNPADPDDVLKAEGDDPYDSLRYGIKTRMPRMMEPSEIKIRRKITATDATWQMIQLEKAMAEERKNTGVVRRDPYRRRNHYV